MRGMSYGVVGSPKNVVVNSIPDSTQNRLSFPEKIRMIGKHRVRRKNKQEVGNEELSSPSPNQLDTLQNLRLYPSKGVNDVEPPLSAISGAMLDLMDQDIVRFMEIRDKYLRQMDQIVQRGRKLQGTDKRAVIKQLASIRRISMQIVIGCRRSILDSRNAIEIEECKKYLNKMTTDMNFLNVETFITAIGLDPAFNPFLSTSKINGELALLHSSTSFKGRNTPKNETTSQYLNIPEELLLSDEEFDICETLGQFVWEIYQEYQGDMANVVTRPQVLPWKQPLVKGEKRKGISFHDEILASSHHGNNNNNNSDDISKASSNMKKLVRSATESALPEKTTAPLFDRKGVSFADTFPPRPSVTVEAPLLTENLHIHQTQNNPFPGNHRSRMPSFDVQSSISDIEYEPQVEVHDNKILFELESSPLLFPETPVIAIPDITSSPPISPRVADRRSSLQMFLKSSRRASLCDSITPFTENETLTSHPVDTIHNKPASCNQLPRHSPSGFPLLRGRSDGTLNSEYSNAVSNDKSLSKLIRDIHNRSAKLSNDASNRLLIHQHSFRNDSIQSSSRLNKITESVAQEYLDFSEEVSPGELLRQCWGLWRKQCQWERKVKIIRFGLDFHRMRRTLKAMMRIDWREAAHRRVYQHRVLYTVFHAWANVTPSSRNKPRV